jgi:hypothetical protein
MAEQSQTLLHSIEGPRGLAQVFETQTESPGRGVITECEMVFGRARQCVPALGTCVPHCRRARWAHP